MMFIFLYTIAPDFSAAMQFFYIKVLNFSPMFMGNLNVIYAIGSILAAILYTTYLKGIKFNKIFISTTICGVILSFT